MKRRTFLEGAAAAAALATARAGQAQTTAENLSHSRRFRISTERRAIRSGLAEAHSSAIGGG